MAGSGGGKKLIWRNWLWLIKSKSCIRKRLLKFILIRYRLFFVVLWDNRLIVDFDGVKCGAEDDCCGGVCEVEWCMGYI